MIRKRKNKSYYQIIGTYVCGDFDVVIEFLPQEDNGRSIGSVEMFQKLHLSINKEETFTLSITRSPCAWFRTKYITEAMSIKKSSLMVNFQNR